MIESANIQSVNITMSSLSSTPSSKPVCRICHQLTPGKCLVEPCNCQGSISQVHKPCLERWLTISRRNKCELCGLAFVCQQETPQLLQYLKTFPRHLVADILLFSFITPIVFLTELLCYQGAEEHMKSQNLIESSLLLAFGLILLIIYFIWLYCSIRTNYRSFINWRSINPNLQLIINPKEKRAIQGCENRICANDNDGNDHNSDYEDDDTITTNSSENINHSLIINQPYNANIRSTINSSSRFLSGLMV